MMEIQAAEDATVKANLQTAYDSMKGTYDTLVEKKNALEAKVTKNTTDIAARRNKLKTDRAAAMTALTGSFDTDKAAYEAAYDLLATKKGELADAIKTGGKDG